MPSSILGRMRRAIPFDSRSLRWVADLVVRALNAFRIQVNAFTNNHDDIAHECHINIHFAITGRAAIFK